MKKTIPFLVCLGLITLGYLFMRHSQNSSSYIHGRFGRYCYQAERANRNIKEFVYFNSYEECLNDLEK